MPYQKSLCHEQTVHDTSSRTLLENRRACVFPEARTLKKTSAPGTATDAEVASQETARLQP